MTRKSERLKLKKQRKKERARKQHILKIANKPDIIEHRNETIEKIRKNTANTRAFVTPISTGPASEVRHIDPETYRPQEEK
jgi:hypothetical protein